ncbi:hypothetical protein [Metasolibacillus meyeri]|uniref:hypothetical protein n=1 Tax=Metasolibacillus meyeri TaxID=1071052 RepID=UPI00187D0DBA|nr:hypothetical protein [Metasolibacillus meyeri]
MDETEAFNNFNEVIVQVEDEYLYLLKERASGVFQMIIEKLNSNLYHHFQKIITYSF